MGRREALARAAEALAAFESAKNERGPAGAHIGRWSARHTLLRPRTEEAQRARTEFFERKHAELKKLRRKYRSAKHALEVALRAAAAQKSPTPEAVSVIEQRREELRRIQALMTARVGGRDSQKRHVRQESGEIIIPLGETAARWKQERRKPEN